MYEELLVTTWNNTWRDLEIACNKIVFDKVDVPGPLLGRGPLWLDSCKRPPPVSDHQLKVFAFWVVAYITGGLTVCPIKNYGRTR